MDAKAIQEAIDNGKRYVTTNARRNEGIVRPVVSLLYDATTAAESLHDENKRLREVLRCARDWRDIDDKSMDEGIYICNRLFDAIDICNDIQLADEAPETKHDQ